MHAMAAELEAQGLPGGSLRLARRGDVATWPGFGEGRWWVQDAAAAIPARLLKVRAGETALDLCAAPGGKTLQLAAAGAKVTALDRSAGRLRRVTAGLARTGLAAEIAGRRRRRPGATRAASTPSCSTRPARPPAPSAAIPMCCGTPGRATSPRWPSSRPACWPPPPRRVNAGRPAGLLRLLAGAGGGRGPGPRVPRRPPRLHPRPHRARRGRRAGREPRAGRLAAHPAASRAEAAWTASSSRGSARPLRPHSPPPLGQGTPKGRSFRGLGKSAPCPASPVLPHLGEERGRGSVAER